MPWHRLVDQETGKTLQVRRVNRDVARLWNKELDPSKRQWEFGLDRKARSPVGSLSQILRNLDTEGFDDHSIHTIESWMRRHASENAKNAEQYEKLRSAFAGVMRTLSRKDRKTVGRFMTKQSRNSFDAGLRAGLAAYMCEKHEHLFGDFSQGGEEDFE